MDEIRIGPQEGPQTQFLSTAADIALYGGGAGGGKSFALLLEPLRHWNNREFGGVIFRRSTTQIRNEGGLWDESMKLYGPLQAHPVESFLEWTFPSGGRMKFAHLEHELTVYDWQGSQIPFIGFDELTHFSEKQFFYMLSRNRSTSGIPGYIRATTNPDKDSWVRELIDWWIDENGFPIPERSGVVRYFIRIDEKMIWADTKEELEEQFGKDCMPKSFTFIPAKVTDNQILMEKNPEYVANLKAQSKVERGRLLDGNWNIRATAGTIFQTQWFPIIDEIPGGWKRVIRFWDRAATKPTPEKPDPDWTRGLKLYEYPNGTYVVADLRSLRDTPGKVDDLIKNTASYDGHSCEIKSQQDPGSAGVGEAHAFVKMLRGYIVTTETMPKDKVTRAKPVSSQCENGNVSVLRAPWNKDFFSELENFPDGSHDDIVDTFSGAFNELFSGSGSSLFDV